MQRRNQLLLFYHAAILILISMLCGIAGFPVATRDFGDEVRQFLRQAHVILVPTGIWMIAVGAALPYLVLKSRWESRMTWLLVISGYAFVSSVLVWGVAIALRLNHLERPIRPFYIGALAITGLTALIGNIVMIVGADAALRYRGDPRQI